MLWILIVVGGFAEAIFFLSVVIELFTCRNWDDVLSNGIKMVIGIAIGAAGVLGLMGIDRLSYKNTLTNVVSVQTNRKELIRKSIRNG